MKHQLGFLACLLAAGCAARPSEAPTAATTPQVVIITTTPQEPVVVVVTATAEPTVPASPQAAPTEVCRKAETVTADEVGQTVAVCGVIVEEGRIPCESCPGGALHYVSLKGELQVVSYDSAFFSGSGFSYEGTCVRVEDEVELLVGRPVLYFSRADGHGNLPCKLKPGGGVVCDQADYFTFLDPSTCY